jgi:pimeloyl-ACP methyl ester carboxylesterase
MTINIASLRSNITFALLKHTKHNIQFSQGTSVLHRICKSESSEKVIFLMHGYFEDGHIFYTDKGKGFAYYLAEKGWDVYVCDLLGKGDSTPKVSKDLIHSQYEIITRDIPTYIAEVRKLSGQTKINLGSHSWGGVILAGYLARSKDKDIQSFVNFGSKRRIGIKTLRKFLYVDIGWTWLGRRFVKQDGYLSAKRMRMGNSDEAKDYYLEADKWVHSKDWKSPVDGFDYIKELDWDTPPSLFFTGKGDKVLGHPKDVKRFANEVNSKITVYKVLGTKTGHQNDYDHINILTHKDAVNDHYPLVLEFLEKFN